MHSRPSKTRPRNFSFGSPRRHNRNNTLPLLFEQEHEWITARYQEHIFTNLHLTRNPPKCFFRAPQPRRHCYTFLRRKNTRVEKSSCISETFWRNYRFRSIVRLGLGKMIRRGIRLLSFRRLRWHMMFVLLWLFVVVVLVLRRWIEVDAAVCLVSISGDVGWIIVLPSSSRWTGAKWLLEMRGLFWEIASMSWFLSALLFYCFNDVVFCMEENQSYDDLGGLWWDQRIEDIIRDQR